jgi:hypothetical protein
MPTTVGSTSPKQAILVARIIWAALIMGELAFTAVTAIVISQPAPQPVQFQPILPFVAFIMLLTIPIGFIIRLFIFARARAANGVLPRGVYQKGNVLFWAACEAPSFFGLVTVLVNRTFWPTIIVTAIAIACQTLTMPMASALE